MVDTPNLLPIDVNALLSTYNNFRTQSEKNAADLDTAYKTAIQAAGAPAAAAIQEGKAQIDLNNVVETAAIKLKRDNAAAAAAFGVNPDASSYVINQLGGTLLKNINKEMQLDASLQADASKGFWDNPLDWLATQISMPFDAMTLETVREGNDRIVANLGRLQALTLEQNKVNAAIDDAASTERLAALNKVTAAKAARAAAASAAEVARLGLDNISMRQRMTAEQLNAAFTMNNVIQGINDHELKRVDAQFRMEANRRADDENRRAEEQAKRAGQAFPLDLEAKQIAVDTARANLEREAFRKSQDEQHSKLLDLQVKAAEGQEEAKKVIQRQLDISAPLLNIRNLSVEEYLMMPENSPIKQTLNRLLFSQDVEFRRLGSNPIDVIRSFTVFPRPLPAGQELVRDAITRIEQATITANEIAWKSLGPDVQRVRLIDSVNATLNKELGNIPETGSIYSPPPLVSTVSMGSMVDNPIVRALKVLAVNPEYPTRTEDVIRVATDIIRAQVASGNPNPAVIAAVATHVSDFYKAIMVDNNNNRQYRKFALPGMAETTTGFKTSVSYPGLIPGMTSREVIDLSNRAAVQAFLTKRMVRDSTLRTMIDNPPSPMQPIR